MNKIQVGLASKKSTCRTFKRTVEIISAIKIRRKEGFKCGWNLATGYDPLCCSQFPADTYSVSVLRWDFNIVIWLILNTKSTETLSNFTFPVATWEPSCKFPLANDENQSEGRAETADSNIFRSSESNVRYKTMKSQLVHGLVML